MKNFLAILAALAQRAFDPFRPADERWQDTYQPPKPVKPTLAETMTRFALSQDWVREESKNRGEGIAKYWQATDYPGGYANREPYCAAGVCWAMRAAAEEIGFKEDNGFQLPRTARAYGFEEWSIAQDGRTWTKIKPGVDIKRGDIVIFNFSHVGIATGSPDINGKFSTIEFNTGEGGGNDGDGVFRKHRPISQVRSRIRLTV